VYSSVQQHAPDILVFANGREAGKSDAIMVAAAAKATGPGTVVYTTPYTTFTTSFIYVMVEHRDVHCNVFRCHITEAHP
jgi:hypothetical protein